ncbi:PBP1A family penicillin-binding protein [Treponema sp. HNW]|uniref:penicillin-binding protein 1A n=1 Tax=Treponema sp. HNW TaxID=3116654 RepID=UPI003D0B5EFA
MKKIRRKIIMAGFAVLLCSVLLGAFTGAMLGMTRHLKNNEHFTEFTAALPTKLLDINGELITEFASDEKREIITIAELPQHVIDALITREDNIFFKHAGFSLKAITRAVIGQLMRRSLGGGSTLTQQIAGTLYLDRTEISVTRKIKELWWAIQMERRYSKQEILELYLNKVYLGGGTYGINAASKYYFGHSARELTPAEAAILVIQLSNPGHYNPFEYPNRAMDRQKYVLHEMTAAGYLTQEEADQSFEDFWLNFDYTRISSSAYYMREDKAPWFSEFARKELEKLMYGTMDVYTGGYTVHTTMNMKHQTAAQNIMNRYITWANNSYRQTTSSVRKSNASATYIPMTELLSIVFDIPQLKISEQRNEVIAMAAFKNDINPALDVLSLMFGMEELRVDVVNRTTALTGESRKKQKIEGTMIAIENATGYITAMVGGSEYGQDNQFIRAVQAKVQPGSSFKPLYYTAAIDSKKFTPTSLIYDVPTIFEKEDGTLYIPQNNKGAWYGSVQLWYALTKSMNIPSLKILRDIGFDAAINQAAALLGLKREELAERKFERVYPLGLGICSVRPVEMARAFAIFANQGKEVVPMAIRSVEDRNGKVILNPERDIRLAQQEKAEAAQIISPQTAYVMTDLLTNTVSHPEGTLGYGSNWGKKLQYKNENGRNYIIPAAGKTGTTQNWSDAWAIGFTPYYTAAFWFGFDAKGESMGVYLNGSSLPGPAWGDFMGAIHEGLPYKPFTKPTTGIVEATVCSVSGGILSPACGNHRTTKVFLEGTQPVGLCELHTNRERAELLGAQRLFSEYFMSGVKKEKIKDKTGLKLDLSFLNDANAGKYTDFSNQSDVSHTGNISENEQNDEDKRLPDSNKFFD